MEVEAESYNCYEDRGDRRGYHCYLKMSYPAVDFVVLVNEVWSEGGFL